MKFWLVVLLGVSSVAQAAPADTQDALAWLRKMATASHRLNYSGTFVYQYGNHVEISRVVHYVNAAGGEFERLEAMEGPPREVIRSNDQVVCYLPASKTVLVEQRNDRHFPELLPEQLNGITDSYRLKKESIDRVADLDCIWIAVLPRDNLRYGRRFCAEIRSGLILRASTVNQENQPVESFAFTQIKLGGHFDRDKVKSRYAEKARIQHWRVDRSALDVSSGSSNHTEWVLSKRPAGFKKLMEVKRLIAGRGGPVSHIVFSDGLAAVSVFIEAANGSQEGQSLSHQGAVNIYTRPYGGQLVTVLGEVPAATVMQVGNSLELKSAGTSSTK